MTRSERWFPLLVALVAVVLAVGASAGRAEAVIEIQWWHAMDGALEEWVKDLAEGFNKTQSEYHVNAIYKGNYTEVMTGAIAAFRAKQQPHIVQIIEVGTGTMMAAKGAIKPVYELMADAGEKFDPKVYLPAVTGYYTTADGRMLSLPLNSSTPVLYYNKDAFKKAGLDPNKPPRTWPEMGDYGKKIQAAGYPCGFSSQWQQWILLENYSAWHNVPISTKQNGFAGFVKATQGKFEFGISMMPYWPDVAGAPQNSIIGGASLWVLSGHKPDEYKGVARFFTYLSSPEVQAASHQRTGYLPITLAAYELTKKQGFYEKNPGTDTSIRQINNKPPTDNSKGLRFGNYIQIRDVMDEELEAVWAGKKTAKEGLDAIVKRGNELLRQFERTSH